MNLFRQDPSPAFQSAQALWKAVQELDPKAVARALRQGADADQAQGGPASMSPLSLLCARAPTRAPQDPAVAQIAQALLRSGANPNRIPQGASEPAISMAAILPGTQLLALMLASGGDPNARDTATGATPLHRAASRQSKPAVDLLLSRGADPNAQDFFGLSPLILAGAVWGKSDHYHGSGSRGSVITGNLIMLTLASHERFDPAFALAHLINSTAGLPELTAFLGLDLSGARLALEQVKRKAPAFCQRLLNQRDCQGNAMTHLLAKSPRKQLDRLFGCLQADRLGLLGHLGADLDAVDAQGWAPIHHCAKRGNTDTALALARNGADLGARAPQGRNALHIFLDALQVASYEQRKQLPQWDEIDAFCLLLVKFGVSPFEPDMQGRNALDRLPFCDPVNQPARLEQSLRAQAATHEAREIHTATGNAKVAPSPSAFRL